MFSDADVKIVGNRPSEDVRRYKMMAEGEIEDRRLVESAKDLGAAIAERFLKETETEDENFRDYGLIIQRRILLSFAATVCIEKCMGNETLSGITQNSFLDFLKDKDSEIYKTSCDMGAYSFYYLAFRRGTNIERRIGQTFAMLCSHDGDPIFQELGEALYCWFFSVIKDIIGDAAR